MSYWQDSCTVSQTKDNIQSSVVVDFHWVWEKDNGRTPADKHGDSDRQDWHLPASHHVLLHSGTVSVFVGMEYSNGSRQQECESKHQIVCPVKTQLWFPCHHWSNTCRSCVANKETMVRKFPEYRNIKTMKRTPWLAVPYKYIQHINAQGERCMKCRVDWLWTALWRGVFSIFIMVATHEFYSRAGQLWVP